MVKFLFGNTFNWSKLIDTQIIYKKTHEPYTFLVASNRFFTTAELDKLA